MVEPSGNWWEGVTKAARALLHVLIPAVTSMPSASTGIGTGTQSASSRTRRIAHLYLHREYLLRQGILKLLAIKDSDIRILTVGQSRDAIDKGLHAGGAFSATIPLVALFMEGS